MAHQAYDLIVLGSGPAGEKGAAQAAYFGKRVAMVERSPELGGAAANTGTLPSKTLRETALMLTGFRSRGLYGVDLSLRRKAKVQDFLYREAHVSRAEQERVASSLDRLRVSVLRGTGSFVDPRTVRVEPREGEPFQVTAPIVLIATGSAPRRPALFPFESERVFDSDSILRLKELPRSLVVVGGGVIGTEYACMLAAFGIETTLIDRQERILPFLDRDVSEALQRAMKQMGIRILNAENVASCKADSDAVRLTLSSGRSLSADALLVAAGRVSNTEPLNLEAARVKLGPRGIIEVNEEFQTSVTHIYAAGDVIGFPALASTSMEQARCAMDHAFNLQYKGDMASILPFGIYTIPEISMAGERERDLQSRDVPYVVGRSSYAENPRGMIIGDREGFLKLVFEADTMKLVGVHIIGESASELVHIGLTALMTGATSELFINTCFNYPTLGDLYKYATYDAMDRKQSGKLGPRDAS